MFAVFVTHRSVCCCLLLADVVLSFVSLNTHRLTVCFDVLISAVCCVLLSLTGFLLQETVSGGISTDVET